MTGNQSVAKPGARHRPERLAFVPREDGEGMLHRRHLGTIPPRQTNIHQPNGPANRVVRYLRAGG
jgi:hypothetical protein